MFDYIFLRTACMEWESNKCSIELIWLIVKTTHIGLYDPFNAINKREFRKGALHVNVGARVAYSISINTLQKDIILIGAVWFLNIQSIASNITLHHQTSI